MLKMLAKVMGAMGLVVAAGAVTQAQSKAPASQPAYPLSTCIVSDEPLGSMGAAVVYNHNGREVRFCCASCETDFKATPDKYLKKLDEAAAKAPATQPARQ